MLRNLFRRVFSFPIMLGSIVVFWVLVCARSADFDPDLWWHLRNVEYLFTNLSFLQVDLYSYTAYGHAWLNHQWLAEIPYYLAWRAGGLLGVYVLFALLLVVIHLGIYYWAYSQSHNLKASFLVTCLSIFLTVVSFGPRTLLFSYLCLLALLLVLARYRATAQAPLWVIPPLFCLWINFHGSWVLGMAVIGVYVVSGLVEGSWGRVQAVRWTPQQLRRLLITLGASAAALFVNPFGHRLVFYPFDMAFRQRLVVAVTDEWASVDFHDARGKVVLVMLAAVLLGLLLSRHKWKVEEVLLAGLSLYAGLTHIRFLFLTAIILAPIFSKMLDRIPPYRPEIDKALLNASVMGAVLLIAAYCLPSRDDLSKAVAELYPTQAVTFIKTRGLAGNVFNHYMWGGYLIYHCREVKPFIDSRGDIFEYTGVLKDYMRTVYLDGSLQTLEKYHIEYVLVPPDTALAYLLKNQTGWKVVYSDKVAAVFERLSNEPGPVTGVPDNERRRDLPKNLSPSTECSPGKVRVCWPDWRGLGSLGARKVWCC